MDAKDARIEHLENELRGALMHLGMKDATEVECAARFQRIFEERAEDYRRVYEAARADLQKQVDSISASARRYALLRQHMVRCRGLDVLARGDTLDWQLDALLREAQRKREEIIRSTPPAPASAPSTA